MNNCLLEIKHELTQHIRPFWEALRDSENGGFYGEVGFDLAVIKTADKGCILNSRLLYFFSEYVRVMDDDSARGSAEAAFDMLKNYFYDKNNGGVYWSVTYDGKPYDTTKHTYNLAFTIYALSKYHAISCDEDSLNLALDIFYTIEEKCRLGAGYGESYTIDFSPEVNEKLSENNVIAEKTMNTLLHIMEAYTELYRGSKNADVLNRLKWTLSEMKDKVYIPESRRLGVFFDADMNSILDLHSYGHDIEATWLIDRALDVIGDDKLKSDFRPMLMDITEEIREKALVDDWLLPECEKGVNLKKRIWWVQCEAVLGFYNAYQKCGNSLYLEISEKIWRQIGTFFIDERIGSEWYNELFEDGTPDESMPIVSEWKCPYHNGRMCLELIERIGSAANLKNK